MATSIPLLCFNDVYRVKQKYVPQPGAPRAPGQADKSGSSGEISVSQFAQLVYDIREGWDKANESSGDESGREGLVLFAGDVFNPSVESSVTRGSHMVSPTAHAQPALTTGADHECTQGGLRLRGQPRL
jgi:hypothetical protein